MKKSLLKTALHIARNKRMLHPEIEHFLHYTFVIQNNQIVDWTTNSKRPLPIHYGYSKDKDHFFRPKAHSEIEAYRKARGLLTKAEPFCVVNIRINKHGQLRNSKPCPCCQELLLQLGCHCCYYTNNKGFALWKKN